ncbi:MAG: hypothetical protein Kow0092_16650 [Deferrisomatales bacterium]
MLLEALMKGVRTQTAVPSGGVARSRWLAVGAVAAALAAGPAAVANAVPVAITNPGFEATVLADGTWASVAPPGWTRAGSAGTFNPTTAQFPGEAPEGANTAYSNGGTLTQTLAETLTAGTTYTLTVQVGDRLDTAFPGYRVQLGVDSGGFVLLAEDNSTLAPNGGFLTSTVVYTATAGDPVGANLQIQLVSSGVQTNFDDVQLTAEPAGPPVADVYLVAKPFVKTLPDGRAVTMWGFARDADDDLATDGGEAATSPGPVIRVAAAGGTLNLHLRNDLPEPVSLFVPGQPTHEAPVWSDGSSGDRANLSQRVRSFAHETAPGGISTYSWTGVRPGTYLYESGTNLGMQVPMGLYGALLVDDGAYPGVPYDDEVVLFYSEIDPNLHDSGQCQDGGGTPSGPCDLDSPACPTGETCVPVADPKFATPRSYRPQYFLVNGEPFDPSDPDSQQIRGLREGDTLLLRFLNAGLRTRVPTLHGRYMAVVAEDGNPYRFAREQYSVRLAAGKTFDAILDGAPAGVYPVVDRTLALTNGANAPGGMMSFLRIGVDAVAVPVANAGFEATVLADGTWASVAPPGWTKVGSAGTFNPTAAQFPGEAPEGANTAYSNGGTLVQTLAETLTAGTTYTLTVQVGDRVDTPFPGYRVQLGVDSGGFVLLAEDNNTLAPNGGFLTSTVAYTATAGDPVGANLQIRLVSSGVQTNFDDVNLVAEPGP